MIYSCSDREIKNMPIEIDTLTPETFVKKIKATLSAKVQK